MRAHTSNVIRFVNQDLPMGVEGISGGLLNSYCYLYFFLDLFFSFLSHFAVSSSLGDTPVKSDDLPVLLGNNLLEQDQPQDFEVREFKMLMAVSLWCCCC